MGTYLFNQWGGNVNFSQLAIKMLHLKSCLYLPVNIFQPPARSPVFTKPLMLYLSCFLSHEALHFPPPFFSLRWKEQTFVRELQLEKRHKVMDCDTRGKEVNCAKILRGL